MSQSASFGTALLHNTISVISLLSFFFKCRLQLLGLRVPSFIRVRVRVRVTAQTRVNVEGLGYGTRLGLGFLLGLGLALRVNASA